MSQKDEDIIARQGIRQMIKRINQAMEELDRGGEPYSMHALEHLETAIKLGYEIIGPDEDDINPELLERWPNGRFRKTLTVKPCHS